MIVSAKQTVKKLIKVYGYGGMVISPVFDKPEHNVFYPQQMPRAFLSALEEALISLSNGIDSYHKSGFVFEGNDSFIHAVNFSHFKATHVRWSILDHVPKCVYAPGLEETLQEMFPSDNG